MTKKFEVAFSSITSLSPSIVYISPSEGHRGYFSVGILHPVDAAGTSGSAAGMIKSFNLAQNLNASEKDALDWAIDWLTQKTGCVVSLSEIAA